MYVSTKYKEGKYSAPNPYVSPAKKDKSYFLKMVEYYYHLYVNDRCAITEPMWDEFDDLRAYARGEQSEEYYKNIISSDLLNSLGFSSDVVGSESVPLDSTEFWNNNGIGAKEAREGWRNVLWQPLTPMPKIMRSIVGRFWEADYDVYVDFVDEHSIFETKKKKWDAFRKNKEKDFDKAFSQNMELPYQEPEVVVESKEDLSDLENNGFFKSDVAIPYEQLISHTYKQSDWVVLKSKLVTDFAVLGIGATYYYFSETFL